MSNLNKKNMTSLEEFLMQDVDMLSSSAGSHTDETEIVKDRTTNNIFDKTGKVEYLKDLLKDDMSTSEAFSLRSFNIDSTKDIKQLELSLLASNTSFADEVIDFILPRFMSLSRDFSRRSLLKTLIFKCGPESQDKLFSVIKPKWIAFCCAETSSKLAQTLIECAHCDLIGEIAKVSKQNLLSLIVDKNGFFVFSVLAENLTQSLREDMFVALASKPLVSKTKNGFLAYVKLIKLGIPKETQYSFVNEIMSKGQKISKNTKRLLNIITKTDM